MSQTNAGGGDRTRMGANVPRDFKSVAHGRTSAEARASSSTNVHGQLTNSRDYRNNQRNSQEATFYREQKAVALPAPQTRKVSGWRSL